MAVVCRGCGAPREVEAVVRPGETKYKRCAVCGGIGIRVEGDLYQPVQGKKPVREPYHQSRYRGGKLVT